jgi:MFS family permease
LKKIIALIVTAQFCCTSVWFAGNAVLPDLILSLHQNQSFIAHLTSAVQFGFIAGTLSFALLNLSDKFSPSKVFFVSAMIASIFNLAVALDGISANTVLLLRFFTGFFLAGIYPVGMKIAADYTEKGLGKALGFLVGALVLGTALPHLIKSLSSGFAWQIVIYASSLLAVLGGLMIYFFVPDGPYRKPSLNINLKHAFVGFKDSNFRVAAFGYFGHMWELYAFWAFLPIILKNIVQVETPNISLLSFAIIALGSVACATSGLLSFKYTPKKVAFIALLLSGICCLLSPMIFTLDKTYILIFLALWAMVVVADSPLFSTLVAQNSSAQNRGTSLTIVNCIGFAITIVSIQVLQLLSTIIDNQYLFMFLAIGPIISLFQWFKKEPFNSSVINQTP